MQKNKNKTFCKKQKQQNTLQNKKTKRRKTKQNPLQRKEVKYLEKIGKKKKNI